MELAVLLLRGSHVTYTVDFGDGSQSVYQNTDVLGFRTPLTLNHTYSSPGTANIIVTITNDVSTATTSLTIVIQNTMGGMQLQVPKFVSFPPGIAEFILISTADILTQMTASFDFGNDKTRLITVPEVGPNVPFVLQNQYFTNDVGEVTVDVNCSNLVSTKTLRSTFTIQRLIKEFHLSTATNFLSTKGDPLSLLTSVQSGSHIDVYIDFGDGSTEYNSDLNLDGDPYSRTITHNYTAPDHYTVQAVVSNGVSNVSTGLPDTIIVQNPIEDLTAVLVSTESLNEDVISLPSGVVSFEVQHSGPLSAAPSEVSCSLLYDSQLASMTTADAISSNSSLALGVILPDWSHVGSYAFSILCSNLISQVTMLKTVEVQRVVDEVTFTASKTEIPVNGTVLFTVGISAGSDVHILLRYGTGDKVTHFKKERFENLYQIQWIYKYEYSHYSPYNVLLVVSNKVYYNALSFPVYVVEEITRLVVTCFYYISDISSQEHPGEGPAVNIFPQERAVYCRVTCDTGNFLTFYWDFENNPLVGSPPAIGQHKYTAPGNYTIKLNVTNPLYMATASVDVIIYQTVLLKEITSDGPKDAFSLMRFTLGIFWPGTQPCYAWDMGDGSPVYVYGEQDCGKNASSSDYFTLWDGALYLLHNHTFKSEGLFKVTVTAWNYLSSHQVSSVAVVKGINCQYPQVDIVGGGRNPRDPIGALRGQWLNFQGNVVPDCLASDKAIFNWTVERVISGDTYQDNTAVPYPLDQTSTDMFQVIFPPKTFIPGSYIITLTVHMEILPALFKSDLVNIEIKPTPIVVKIVGGSARSVGYNSNVTIDAIGATYDPDVDTNDKTGFEFDWYCYRINESLTVAENGSIIDPLIEIPTAEMKANLTGPGCFRTGIGKLNTSKGAVTIDTYLMEPESNYIIFVKVKKGTKTGEFRQELVVVEGDPPEIEIV